jgi:hypothetical protein
MKERKQSSSRFQQPHIHASTCIRQVVHSRATNAHHWTVTQGNSRTHSKQTPNEIHSSQGLHQALNDIKETVTRHTSTIDSTTQAMLDRQLFHVRPNYISFMSALSIFRINFLVHILTCMVLYFLAIYWGRIRFSVDILGIL